MRCLAFFIGLYFVGGLARAVEPPAAVTTQGGRILEFDPDWTPRPQDGDVPAYVKETDVDWVDDRLQRMDTGRTFNATFKYRHGDKDVMCYKGTAIRVGEHGEAAWLYDRNQLRWCCAWACEPLAEPATENPTGFTPYLNHSDRRFGLMNTPTPKGELVFSVGAGSDWSDPSGVWHDRGPATVPTPASEGRHYSIVRWGDRSSVWSAFQDGDASHPSAMVIETPWAEEVQGRLLFTRTVEADRPHGHRLRLLPPGIFDAGGVETLEAKDRETTAQGFKIPTPAGPLWLSVLTLRDPECMVVLDLSAGAPTLRFTGTRRPQAFICLSRAADWTLQELLSATRALSPLDASNRGPFREMVEAPADLNSITLETRGVRAEDDASYVVDTVALPFENPYRALLFCSGVDFVPRECFKDWSTGEGPDVAAVSTAHGDVWLVDGVDDDLTSLRWKRFATGLYQPLGLKVVDGQIVVLERGQLTALEDTNQDGQAEVYRCICGDWHVGGGEHSYHTSLVTDPEGNFYFHAGGDTHTPTGGTLIKVLKDGSRSMVYCTGFRHPIGLGVLPDGRITGADQEGNWMPSTRLDIYKPGGFYGDMRTHHRKQAPESYDGPLCWIPRQLDGSAGGEVFVDRDDFGPLSRQLLHMSYGNCSLMLVLRQEHAGIEQAGVIDLGLRFLAGVQRGCFRESDGCVYLAGMDGWQTAAQADGCLQRVRFTGKPLALPISLTLESGGVRLGFNVPITRDYDNAASQVATDARRYHIEMWNYLWSKEYGSKRYSVLRPGQVGQDELKVESATLVDPWTVFLEVPGLRPCMQLQVEYDILAFAPDLPDQRLKGAIYSTVHTTGPAVELRDGERIALLGGTLMEREQRYGFWEHAITAAHPDKSLTFRNLAWAGDTVWAESRGVFDPPEKGYARLLEQVREQQPTLLILNYGGNEAWSSLERGVPVETAVERFVTQYGKLIDDMTRAAAGAASVESDSIDPGAAAKFVLLTPLPLELGVGPNRDPSRYNEHLAAYVEAIENLARERELPCINLGDLYTWHGEQASGDPAGSLTDNGLHLSEYGYWRSARWIRERLCANTSAPALQTPTQADAAALLSHFDRETQRIEVEALPAEQLKQATACLEFGGQLSSLPTPSFGDHLGQAPLLKYSLSSRGTYRMEVDGEQAARGTSADWFEGLPLSRGPDEAQSQALLEAIRRKNELFFHRWRPQNITYLFLFRAHEQGNNAVEIPQFDPLIAAEEERIAELRVPQRHTFRLVREANGADSRP